MDMRHSEILKTKYWIKSNNENKKIKNLDDKMVQFLITVNKMFKN